MSTDVIIAMISDAGFIIPTVVALESMKESKSWETQYKIYLFLKDVDDKVTSKIKSMCETNFEIEIKYVEEKEYDLYENKELSATATALYKFELPNLLSEYEKVLYLDGDIIVKKDLSTLYATDLDGFYAAAVEDMPLIVNSNPQMIKLKQKSKYYFNSGVMLLNLKEMRNDFISDKLVEYKEKGINYFMDQDAFNVVLAKKIKSLSLYYNLIFRIFENYYFEEISEFYSINTYSTVDEYYKHATIIHLASPYKPWKYNTPILSEMFEELLRKTPFYDQTIQLLDPEVASGRKIEISKKGYNRILVICENLYDIYYALINISIVFKNDVIFDLLYTEIELKNISKLKKYFKDMYHINNIKNKKKFLKEYNDIYISIRWFNNNIRIIDTIKEKTRIHLYTNGLEDILERKNIQNIYSYHLYKAMISSNRDGKILNLPIPSYELNKNMMEILKTEVFGKQNYIKEKYVIFDDNVGNRETTVLDLELYEYVSEIVDKKNILVLVLKEEKKKIYEIKGFKTYLIEDNLIFREDCIFISNFSSLSFFHYINSAVNKMIYLFKIFKGGMEKKEYNEYKKIYELRKEKILDSIYLPNNMDELERILLYLKYL